MCSVRRVCCVKISDFSHCHYFEKNDLDITENWILKNIKIQKSEKKVVSKFEHYHFLANLWSEDIRKQTNKLANMWTPPDPGFAIIKLTV